MLKNEHRVKKPLFSRVFKQSRTIHGDFFTLRYYRDKDTESKPKFSFVVPKSVDKSAVKRNLMKRRGYGAIKPYISDVKNGYIMIFFAKKPAVLAKYPSLCADISSLIKKSGAY